MQSIGQKIYLLRKSNNLTQKAFSQLIGITPSFVSKIEKGKEYPSITVIRLISIIFAVDEKWLISEESKQDEIVKITFGKQLRILRKKLNFTQQQLAEKTGISIHCINSYELGRREPNSKTLAALERFFNVSGSYLRGEVNNKKLVNQDNIICEYVCDNLCKWPKLANSQDMLEIVCDTCRLSDMLDD